MRKHVTKEIEQLVRSIWRAVSSPKSEWLRRKALHAAEENRIGQLESIKTSEELLKTIDAATHRHEGIQHDYELASAIFFGSNLTIDLNSAMTLLISAEDLQLRNYMWRTLAVTLHEGIEQYSRFVLPALRRILLHRIDAPELLIRHRSSSKRLGKIQKDHGAHLKAVRNNWMAHREANYHEFISVRDSFDESRLTLCLSQFLEVCTEIQSIYLAATLKVNLKIRSQRQLD